MLFIRVLIGFVLSFKLSRLPDEGSCLVNIFLKKSMVHIKSEFSSTTISHWSTPIGRRLVILFAWLLQYILQALCCLRLAQHHSLLLGIKGKNTLCPSQVFQSTITTNLFLLLWCIIRSGNTLRTRAFLGPLDRDLDL